MVDIDKLKLALWKIIWFLVPLWLGTLIHQKTGYILGMRTKEGKPIQFYFQRQKPSDFTSWGNNK